MKHFLPCIALSAVLLGGCGDTKTPPEATPQASDSAEMVRPADVAAPSGSSSEQTRTQDGYALPTRDGWWRNLPRPIWRDYPTVKTLNPWFDVHQIRDGVFALYESGQQAEAISWLIVGSRQALLFDTGTGMGDIRSVVRQLTRLPVMVINSHSHTRTSGATTSSTMCSASIIRWCGSEPKASAMMRLGAMQRATPSGNRCLPT